MFILFFLFFPPCLQMFKDGDSAELVGNSTMECIVCKEINSERWSVLG